MAKQRLIENVLVPHKLLKKLDVPLTEATIGGQTYKALAVYRFPFTRPNEENLNGRIYPYALWDRIFASSPVTLSLVNHPEEGAGDPARVWAVLRNHGYNHDKSLAYVDCYIIDNELGRTALGVLRAGGDVGLSSSGFGDFEADGKTVDPDSFELERYFDWVLEPSYSVFGTLDDVKTGMGEKAQHSGMGAAGKQKQENMEGYKMQSLREKRAARLYQETRDERNLLQFRVQELEQYIATARAKARQTAAIRRQNEAMERQMYDEAAQRRHDTALALSVWETSGHKVEKYLDEWMLGKKGQKGTGVFDMETGAFQTVTDENVLYRDLVFRTFIYEVEREENVNVMVKSLTQELKFALESIEEDISILRKESKGDGLPAQNIKKRGYIKDMELQMASINEVTKQRNVLFIPSKQIIPGLDKLLAAVNGLANQGIAKIPIASNITKRFIPTIRITPPVMKKPYFVENGLPLLWDHTNYGTVQFTDAAAASEQSTDMKLLDDIKHHIEQVKVIVSKTPSGTESSTVNLGNVKWTARQETTSETVYNVAIQDYDVGSYDYQSGDGVAYTVNLAVRDVKRTEYPK